MPGGRPKGSVTNRKSLVLTGSSDRLWGKSTLKNKWILKETDFEEELDSGLAGIDELKAFKSKSKTPMSPIVHGNSEREKKANKNDKAKVEEKATSDENSRK